jgi:transmembrane sensor
MNKAALRDAARWFAQLGSGDAGEQDRRDWGVWLAAHPDHRWAWRQVEELQGRLQLLPGNLSATAFRIASSAGKPDRGRVSRRNALKGLGAVLVCGSAAALGVDGIRRQGWFGDYRTAVGERREITLADGSVLMLNTDTTVDVIFDTDRRLVRLRAGEILIETAPDPLPVYRPFSVETAQGEVRALGTRFTVRQYDGWTGVTVLRDAVEIRPLEAAWNTEMLAAGRQTRFSRTEVRSSRVAEDPQAAWTRGMLIASDWRLADLAAEIARYRPGWLVCDPAVAGLRISGAFPIRDTDVALAAIERALPVRTVRRTRYWVGLEPRDRPSGTGTGRADSMAQTG